MDLGTLMRKAKQLRDAADQLEHKALESALVACDWFETNAAKMLKLPRSTFKHTISTRFADLGRRAVAERKRRGYAGRGAPSPLSNLGLNRR